MKTEVTDVATCRKRIAVEVPADKVNSIFEEIYSTIGKQVNLKGFRKGHAPKAVLKKRFGSEVAQDARMRLLQTSLDECFKSNNILPMGEPDIEKIADLQAAPDTSFSFTAEVDVQPDFEMPQFKGLKLVEYVLPVEDKDVDEQLQNLAKSFAVYNESEDGAQEKDALTVDAVMTCEDEETLNLKEQKIYAEGQRLFGIEEDVAKVLAGVKAGEEKVLDITIPDSYHKEALRGKKASLKLNIIKVERPDIPAIDDELAGRVGMQNLEAIKTRIKENIEAERKSKARANMEKQATKLLLDSCSFDLPETFMDKQKEAALMRNRMQLAQMGASQEYLKEKEEEMKETTNKQTDEVVRRTIIVGRIADQEKVQVTEQDIQQHIMQLANAYRTSPQEIVKTIEKQDGFGQVAAEIRDIKVIKMILDSAEVETKAEAIPE